MRILDLNQLMTFKTIAECNSITLASQRLHKTQAAISIQLKKLEQQTNCTLVKRGYHSAQLTADGEVLLQYASKLLSLNNEALHRLKPTEVTGLLRFGIPDDYASIFLLPAIQSFVKRYENVQIQIISDLSQNLVKALQEDKLDLALVTLKNSDQNSEILRRDQLYWVADKDYCHKPNTPTPLALYPQGCDYRKNILEQLSQADIDYHIAFECTGVTGVKIAVDSGLAITATCKALIQPNWRILDDLALPVLDAVVIELRTGNGEITEVQRLFSQELRRQVLSV